MKEYFEKVNRFLEQKGISKKGFYAVVGVGVFFVLIMILSSGKKETPTANRIAPTNLEEVFEVATEGRETFVLNVQRFITATKKNLDELGSSLDSMNTRLGALEKSIGEIKNSQRDFIADQSLRLRELSDRVDANTSILGRLKGGKGLEGFGLSSEEPIEIKDYNPGPSSHNPGNPGKNPPPSNVHPTPQSRAGTAPNPGPEGKVSYHYHLPGGSYAKATLITGIEAPPIGEREALPCLLALSSDFRGPNVSNIPLRGCTAIGKSEGDLAMERVIIEVVTLSCVMPSGVVMEREVKGYVVGEDGVLGMKGKVISKRGRKLGASILASFTAGLAEAIGAGEITTTVSPEGIERAIITGSTLTYASAHAIAEGVSEIADFYKQEAMKLFPVIEAQAGREVNIVLKEGVDISEIEEKVSPFDIYRGLD